MKQDLRGTVLVGVFILAALVINVLCFAYVRSVRELKQLQEQVRGMNRNRSLITSFAAELQEYRKSDPAIDPLLEQMGFKPLAPAPAPNRK